MFRAQNVFLVLLVLLFNSVAFAATVTNNLTVNATVNATCIFGNITSINFGNYSGVQNDATGSIEVTCNNGTAYNIGLNAGAEPSATVTNRVMTGTPSGTLGYRLFQDPARTINWGNTPPTDTVNLTGNGAVQLSTVYGRIAAGAVPATGSYNDTVVITVTY